MYMIPGCLKQQDTVWGSLFAWDRRTKTREEHAGWNLGAEYHCRGCPVLLWWF